MSSSWDAYVQSLVAEKSITDAAIVGATPGSESVWASTPSLACITPDEIKKLCGDSSAMLECGPKVAGKKCMMLRDNRKDEAQFCLQLKMSTKDGGFSICVGVAKTALVIAVGGEGVGGGQMTNHVYSVVDHLRKSGY
ncbi:profilin-1-like [Centropristis striata]|uniref:profilin-1-like n=1 Tax=Centropristis striata TaxID=184440 RepID=UPI0027DF953F|nr:profilin-1-like [Centropristis striata]